MSFKERVEIAYRFLQIPTIIKHILGDSNKRAILAGNDRRPTRDIVNQRYFSKRVSWVVKDVLLATTLFRILTLDTVRTLKDDVKVLPTVSFAEHRLVSPMTLQLQ